jgi:tRNA dimethylallyltransferase
MPSKGDPRLLVIVGPTGVGKTELAVRLAQRFNGEIVSADSRQTYRTMDIGTAKPTVEQRALAPHHLIDVVEPDQTLTAAEFQSLAVQAIQEIGDRGKLPMLVGGTGLYVRVVTEGFSIPRVAPDPELRARLIEETPDAAALHLRLAALDPAAAARIDARNVRRVLRALEVCLTTGCPISDQQERGPSRFRELRLGLTMPRSALYARIDARVNRMVADGLVDEVRRLVARGYSWELAAMSAVGYREIGSFLRGELRLAEAIRQIQTSTHRYVRQQYNWFHLDDPRIRWMDASSRSFEVAAEIMTAWLDEGASS